MNVRVLKPLHVKGKTIEADDKVYELKELGLDTKSAKILIEKKAIQEVTENAKKRR